MHNKDRPLFAYAAGGIVYDALDAVSDLIDARPVERKARERRAAMFGQAGLETAAKLDRAAP